MFGKWKIMSGRYEKVQAIVGDFARSLELYLCENIFNNLSSASSWGCTQ